MISKKTINTKPHGGWHVTRRADTLSRAQPRDGSTQQVLQTANRPKCQGWRMPLDAMLQSHIQINKIAASQP